MTEKPEQPFSPAMLSALQAVTRMRGGSMIAYGGLLAKDAWDDRHQPADGPNPQQNRKPFGR